MPPSRYPCHAHRIRLHLHIDRERAPRALQGDRRAILRRLMVWPESIALRTGDPPLSESVVAADQDTYWGGSTQEQSCCEDVEVREGC